MSRVTPERRDLDAISPLIAPGTHVERAEGLSHQHFFDNR
jgi:hypothetical protein